MTTVSDEELALVTSYFNLAGGRRQDNADTFRVEESVPSPTAPEGAAALYIVTEASAGGHMGPRARRMVADAVAWEYAQHGEVPPAPRLKSALRTAHEEVLREFDGHVSVGASVIAVENNTIFLAQTAPSQVYVVHQGQLASLPGESGGSSPHAHALGSAAGPRISLARDLIEAGDVIVLCSSWFQTTADQEEMRDCFGAGTADDIIQDIFDLAKQHDVRDCSVIVIEVVLAEELDLGQDEDPSTGFMEQVDQAVQALAGVGRMLWSELRTVAEPDVADGTKPSAAARSTPDTPVDEHTGASDIERPPRRARERSRPAQREAAIEPGYADPEFPSDESEVPYRFEHEDYSDPHAAGSASDFEDEPYGVHRDQVTEEVPIIAEGNIEAEESQPSTAFDEQQTAEFRAPLVEQPTIEFERIPDRSTAEFPAVTSEPETPPQDRETTAPESTRPARRWRFGGSSLDPEPELEEVPEEDEPYIEPVPAPTRPRQAPIPPWRRAKRADPPMETDPEPEPDPELEEVNSRIQHAMEMDDVIPPVQAFPDTSTEPSRIYATSKDIQAVNRRPRRFGGIGRPTGSDPLSGPAVIRPGMGDIDLRHPVSRPAAPAIVWVAAAVFLVLVAGSLYLFFKRHSHTTVANPYPRLVRADLRLANSSSDPATQDTYLTKAGKYIDLARQDGASASEITSLRSSLNATSDALHHITRISAPVVLTDFSQFPGSQPSEIATAPGIVYVLDAGRKSVYSVSASAGSNPSQLVTAGETDTTIQVGTPQHLASDGTNAVILDDKDVLVRASTGTKTAATLTMADTSAQIPGIVASSTGVYVLDTASSQVWGYPGTSTAPNAFFDPPKPDLSQAVSMTLDGQDLYILRKDGTVLKFDFISGKPVRFTARVRTPLKRATVIFTSQSLKYIWIADPGSNRIVQIDKSGGYVRTYLSPALAGTKSISVGPAGNTVYVMEAKKLVSFPVVP